MYLTIDTTRYAVLSASLDGDIRYTVDKPPSAVSGTVTLCADDGMVIRTDNTADYLHPRVKDGVIILSNTPEPEPVPVTPPEPVTPPDPIGDLNEVVAELTDRVVNLELK